MYYGIPYYLQGVGETN